MTTLDVSRAQVGDAREWIEKLEREAREMRGMYVCADEMGRRQDAETRVAQLERDLANYHETARGYEAAGKRIAELEAENKQLAGELSRWEHEGMRRLGQVEGEAKLVASMVDGRIAQLEADLARAAAEQERTAAYLKVTLDIGNQTYRERDEARAWARHLLRLGLRAQRELRQR